MDPPDLKRSIPMSPKKMFGISLLSFIMFSFPAWGQPGKDIKQPYEKIRERIQMIKMWKLTDTLKLDREEAARFFAINRQFEETKKKINSDLQEEVQRLRILMRNLSPPERELRETVSRIKNKQKEQKEIRLKQMEEEMQALKLEQQARYVLFQIDFRRDMEMLIREIREEKSHRPGVETVPEKNR